MVAGTAYKLPITVLLLRLKFCRVEYAAYTLPKAEKLPGSNGLQLPLVPHLGKQPTSAGELTVRLANRTMNSRESCTGSSAEHRDQSPCRRNIVASLLGCGLILEATKSRSEDLPQEGLMVMMLVLMGSPIRPSLWTWKPFQCTPTSDFLVWHPLGCRTKNSRH